MSEVQEIIHTHTHSRMHPHKHMMALKTIVFRDFVVLTLLAGVIFFNVVRDCRVFGCVCAFVFFSSAVRVGCSAVFSIAWYINHMRVPA